LKRFYRLEDEDEEEKEKEEEIVQNLENELVQESDSERSQSDSNPTSKDDDDDDDDDESLIQPGDDQIANILDESLAQHPLVIRDVPRGQASSRLAIVNLDWDQIKAIDIFHLLQGFKPVTGVVKAVKIYPSEFGKERMAKEALEGPPKDIFQQKDQKEDDLETGSSSGDEEDPDELEPLKPVMNEEGEDFVEIQLRKYQLERLRYFYAVVECDSVETAATIYKHCDGTEFEMSANFMDFRFIPDEISFEGDVPTDVADQATNDYKSKPDLTTAALQHSKVKLTWDLDDPDRSRLTKVKNAKFDHLENDLRAYLASSSDEEEENFDEQENNQQRAAKYRDLLLSNNRNVYGRKSHEDNDDLQITFTSGFDNQCLLDDLEQHKQQEESEVDHDDDDDDIHLEAQFSATDNSLEQQPPEETVFEARLRKMKEHKKAKKESRLAKIEAIKAEERRKNELRKQSVKRKHRHSDQVGTNENSLDEEDQKKKAELDLLLLGDNVEDNRFESRHFDMDEVIKREKLAKSKRGKKSEPQVDVFEANIDDPRFKAIYEEPSFGIDPTHPSYKPTKTMKRIISERQARLHQRS
jgi:hypothetical protein